MNTREKVDLLGEAVGVLIAQTLSGEPLSEDSRIALLLYGAAIRRTGSCYISREEEAADEIEDRTGELPAPISLEYAQARYDYANHGDDEGDDDTDDDDDDL